MKRLLPLGTVLMIDTPEDKKMMVIGRLIKKNNDDSTIWDYCACAVPVGIADNDIAFFNHDQVKRLLFIGFQDEEEMQYSYACKMYDKEKVDSSAASKEE